MGLLGMKALNKSWKEISEVLAGKDEDDIKKKYRELYVDAPASIKPKKAEAKKKEAKKETEDKKEEKKEEEKEEKKEGEKEEEKEEKKDEAKEEKKDEAENDEAKAGDERKKITGGGKKGGKEGKQGKKGQRGQKGQQGKEKAEEAKPEEVKVEEAKPKENDGILKAKVTAGEKGKGGELKSINGHPVIFVDDDEELEFEEVSTRVRQPSVGLRLLMFAISCCISMASTRALMSKSGSRWTRNSSTGLEKGSELRC